jgi:GDP-L-fucose synthase
MKTLVLGGSGFIGQNLMYLLFKNKYEVVGTYLKTDINRLDSRYKWIRVDLRSHRKIDRIFNDYDLIINCAAVTSGAKVINENPLLHLYDNLLINTNIACGLSLTKNKRFIFISSSVVYPDSSRSMSEKHAKGEFSQVYEAVGSMKYYSENVFRLTAEKSIDKNINVFIIRPSNLYGPMDKFGDGVSKVIPSLIKRMINTESVVKIWGDGKQVRDFLYIDDFVGAILLLIKKTKFNHTYYEYNISNGEYITIKNLAKEIREIVNKDLRLIYLKDMPKTIDVRKISSKKFQSEFEWKAKTSIKIGLTKTIKWYKENS